MESWRHMVFRGLFFRPWNRKWREPTGGASVFRWL